MTDKNLAAVPDAPEGKGLGANLAAGTATKVKATRGQRTTREPQMRALVRILGPGVRDIFPEQFRQAVEQGYQFWKDNNDSYLAVPFDTEQEKDDCLTVMRAYAECAGDKGYTIATRNGDDPLTLLWRAQDRRVIGGDD